MTTGISGVRLHCEHVSTNHAHCNRAFVVSIDLYETPKAAIERDNHDWGIVDREIRCPEHNDNL
jgi:hypothetical protein